ncbi:PEP-utilizing enzyme [Actinomycetospora sp. CA-101289]|uniref:PEP-utilizing enzyme n=1 Tax=Actinomycetospora sp. CA-101289 TaxID=3239893 RepID=UPI003D95413C
MAEAEPTVPEGFWQRDVAHCPRPLSTLMATAVLPLVGEASRWWFAGVGALPERLDWREIGGWTYLRRVDAAGTAARAAAAVTRGDEVLAEDLAGAGLRSWRQAWRPALEARSRALRAIDRTRLPDDALAEHLAATVTHQSRALEVHFQVHAVITAALAELRHTAREVLGDDNDVIRLLGGSAPALLEVPAALDHLVRLAGREPVRALLDQRLGADVEPPAGDPPARADLVENPDVTAFLTALDAYLERYGHRTPGYELIHPTAAEAPTTVLRAVHARLDAGSPTAVPVPSSRVLVSQEGPAPVPDAVDGPARVRLQRARARAAAAYPLREESGPVTWTEPLALIRYAALEVGRRARSRGTLDSIEDVFWLDHDEIRALASGMTVDRRVPATRRHDATLAEHSTPPPLLGQNPGPPRIDDLPNPARWLNEGMVWLVGRMLEPSRLAARAVVDRDVDGVAAARGRATGTVRVVRHDRDLEELRPGDVLVCPTFASAWTVVLSTVGALVTDSGGVLSHSAIMAREFGVPAVVATGDASRVLIDGQLVEVDGDAGLVRVTGSMAAP